MIYSYFRKIIGIVVLVLTIGFLMGSFAPSPAITGSLSDRVAQFPNWHNLPPTQPVDHDLIYPAWFEGEWRVESTLVELEAPLAPDIRTPGFEKNRSYLNQPVYFTVRFGQKPSERLGLSSFWADSWSALLPGMANAKAIVADRAFNGLSIAQAYLGTESVRSVQVDRRDPNRQVTTLADGVKLLSVVTERSTETPDPQISGEPRFLTTELTHQFFQDSRQIYLNVVETTTDYRYDVATAKITAEQITAIYLSPQDPNYFQALGHPVALYRYDLKLRLSTQELRTK